MSAELVELLIRQMEVWPPPTPTAFAQCRRRLVALYKENRSYFRQADINRIKDASKLWGLWEEYQRLQARFRAINEQTSTQDIELLRADVVSQLVPVQFDLSSTGKAVYLRDLFEAVDLALRLKRSPSTPEQPGDGQSGYDWANDPLIDWQTFLSDTR